MRKLGFLSRWINLIMNCITTPTFSVAKGSIQSQRRLRQGCSLSLYLFIIWAEAFSSLLKESEKGKKTRRVSFNKELIISHLLLVDDNLVFAEASTQDCNKLKKNLTAMPLPQVSYLILRSR